MNTVWIGCVAFTFVVLGLSVVDTRSPKTDEVLSGGYLRARSTTTASSGVWLKKKPTKKWIFFGAAGGTARLTLASSYHSDFHSYQISIGENDNTETTFLKDGHVFQTLKTLDIMSPDETRDFWVSWENGISFGKGRYRDRQTVFSDPDTSYKVTAVEFSANYIRGEVKWNMYMDNSIQMSFRTDGSGVDQLWLDASNLGHLVFTVQACHSADLFLATVPRSHETDDHPYRVAIQTESNHTYISKGSGSKLAERHTPGLLSCRQKRNFWLTWQAGTLALGSGRDHGFNTIISYDDFDIFQVTSISLATYNTTGVWEIPLEDEQFQYLDRSTSSDGVSGGEIAGFVIGMLALFALFGVIVYFIFKPPKFLEPLVRPGGSGSSGLSTGTNQGDFAPGFDNASGESGQGGGATETNVPSAAGFSSATSSDVKDSGISFENPLNKD